MVNQMLARFFCRKYAPLLVPYAENALNEPLRSRVARHLDACPACREEVALVSDMGALLRANPPAAPAPADDLWKRIEAQIRAEQPAPPVARPVPVPVSASARSQWRGFATAFGYSAVPVAAAVAVVVVVAQPFVQKDAATDEGTTLALSSPTAPRPVEIDIRAPVRPAVPAGERTKAASIAAVPAMPAAPVPKAEMGSGAAKLTRIAAAEPMPSRPRYRRAASLRARDSVRSVSPAASNSATSDFVAAKSAAYAFRENAPVPAKPTRDKINEAVNSAPTVAADLTPPALMPSPAPASSLPAAAPSAGPTAMAAGMSGAGFGRAAEASASLGARTMSVDIEKKVVLAAEEAVLPVREAPAERRVSEVTDQMFRHRNMFSYAR